MLEINKIHNIDCIDGLKKLENDSIDITITSPPYNVNSGKYGDYRDNKKDYYGFIVNTTEELLRVTKHYSFINIQLLNNNKVDLFEFINKFRYNIKDIIVWNKQSAQPVAKCLCTVFEFIFVLSKRHLAYSRNFERCNFDHGKTGKAVNNSVFFNYEMNNTSGNHAVFPEALIRWILNNFSEKDDIILDPFMGSGTTAYVAKNMGRKFIGFDIDKKYIDYANKRLSQQNLLNV